MESHEILRHTQRANRLDQLRDINIVATAITAAIGIGGGFIAVFLLSRSTVRRIQWIGDKTLNVWQPVCRSKIRAPVGMRLDV